MKLTPEKLAKIRAAAIEEARRCKCWESGCGCGIDGEGFYTAFGERKVLWHNGLGKPMEVLLLDEIARLKAVIADAAERIDRCYAEHTGYEACNCNNGALELLKAEVER